MKAPPDPAFPALSEPAEDAAAAPQYPLALDEETWEARWQDQRLGLSPKEFQVLAYFSQRLGQIVSYDALLKDIWGVSQEEGGSLAQVRSTVKRLRQKLAALGNGSCQLVNVRSIGYRLDLFQTSQHASSPPVFLPAKLALILLAIALLLLVAVSCLMEIT